MVNPPVPCPSYDPPSNCMWTYGPLTNLVPLDVAPIASLAPSRSSSSLISSSACALHSTSSPHRIYSGTFEDPTSKVGLYYAKSMSMAYSAGCALWDNLYRACASLDTQSVSFWQWAACRASFLSPSYSARNSSKGTGSFSSAWASAQPHPATGDHSLGLLGSRWSMTIDIPTWVTRVSARNSFPRSKANQDTPFSMRAATSLTDVVTASVQVLLSSPSRRRSGSVISAKWGTYSR